MPSRRAARPSSRPRRRAPWVGALPAFLLVVLSAAWPGFVSAASPVSAPAVQAARQATWRANCPPAGPGYYSCMSLVRTDVAPLSRAQVSAGFTPSGYSPADLRSAYALTAAAASNGGGITVAVVDYSDLPTAASDLATYRSQFGLSPCTVANGCFRKIDEHGGTNYPVVDIGWSGEIALDIEMVSAICPNCHILLVEAASASVFDLGTAVNEAASLGAVVISNSYGGTDQGNDASMDASFFNHPGVAITFSSGDDGYGVQYPAASRYVTSVGGTTLNTAGNARGWTESAWSGAGSGCSVNEAKPSWQGDSSCSFRTVADVSAVADPSTGVAMYRGGWGIAGGTSVASPIIAGVYALAGVPAAGTNPASYLYAQTGFLNDVSGGSNGSCGGTYLCTGLAAYDGPTGLGTPNGIGAFVNPALPGAPTSVTGVGGDASVAVSWHAAAANGHAITGYTATSTPGGHTCTTTGTLTCTVNGLTNGTSYTFKVAATNSVGTGSASAASAPVVPATVPGAPAGVSGTPADGAAVISWAAPGSTGGSPITGYTATSAPLGKTCTTAGALSCTILGLANGTPYTFTVTATNSKGTGPASSASSPVTPVTVPGATYVPVSPDRIMDSRVPRDVGGHLVANTAVSFQVTQFDTANIPDNAIAVTGNLTVTGQTAPGYFALTTTAQNSPTTSTLNFPVGDNRANGVTVPLGTNGTHGLLWITYAATAGATANAIFDLTGYFVPGSSGATYVPVTPDRIMDSRVPRDVGGHLVANTAVSFQVSNESLDPTKYVPADAVAVTGNLTVTGQSAAGFLALTTVAQNSPTTSTLNFPVGDNRANGVTAPLGTNGTDGVLWITYAAIGGATTQAIFDVTGYFVP